MWEPKIAQDESVWTEEYARLVISSYARRPLPHFMQRIGSVEIGWHEPIPGRYHVHATGGSVDDRRLARAIVGGQLDAYGLRPVGFTVGGPTLRKMADWNEVQQKAIRLMNDGNVQILRNAPDTVVGHVIGDHGEYQTEISRQGPDSNVIDHWTCECPWDQFAWQRTRQWKNMEGRPCAHVLATHWYAQGTPLDQEFDPTTGQPIGQPGAGGQMGLPLALPNAVRPGGPPTPPMPAGGPQAPSQQLSIPGIDPGMATATPPVPPTPGILPPMPVPPMPVPVSVPGAKLPDATNPMQWPGGTFSKTAGQYPEDAPAFEMSDGRIIVGEEGEYHSDTISRYDIDVDDIVRVGDTHGDGVAWYDMDYHEYEAQHGPDDWAFTAATGDTFENSDMVRINSDEYGIAEGKSEEHGAGQWKTIKKNSIGEVLGQDQTTGWVDVIFPIHDSGPMEPYHIRAWIEPANLTPMPGIQKPGPFIRRKR